MNDRKINTDALSEDQLEASIKKLTQVIDKDVNETCERVNQLLARYGLKCKMQLVFQNLDDFDEPVTHDKIEA
jgi:hypothetical protein